MVTGNEKVFDNITEAINEIQNIELEKLSKDTYRTRLNSIFCDENTWGLKNPYSSYCNMASEDSFIMTKLRSGRYSLKPNLKRRAFLYRGESEFHSPSKPNLFRNKFQTRYTIESILYQELFLIILSHPLVQLLDSGIEFKGETYKFEMNLFGLSQHYYSKTSLLDFTSDINVASFFASTIYDSLTDIYSPILNKEHKFGVLYYYELDVFGDFKVTPLSTIGLQIFPRSERQKGLLIHIDKNRDFNNFGRLNAFLFKHKPDIAQEIYEKFDGGKKLFPDDILAHHWKAFNQNSKVVSNRTIRLNLSLNPQCELSDIEHEVTSQGFKIEDYIPAFSEKELEWYYSDIGSGFWENFCDKIYIPGDDGAFKSYLKSIRYNNRYRWAFEPGIPHTINYNDGYLLRQYKSCLI